ncbi:hypothetical protein THAOC_21817, partial [Thalassiosira oceanica]
MSAVRINLLRSGNNRNRSSSGDGDGDAIISLASTTAPPRRRTEGRGEHIRPYRRRSSAPNSISTSSHTAPAGDGRHLSLPDADADAADGPDADSTATQSYRRGSNLLGGRLEQTLAMAVVNADPGVGTGSGWGQHEAAP